MYVAAAGLIPISPVIAVAPVVEIPVFAIIAKSAAVPRGTGVGPAAMAAGAIKATVNIAPREIVHRPDIPGIYVAHVFMRLSLQLVEMNTMFLNTPVLEDGDAEPE
jgi:hypothetical protein